MSEKIERRLAEGADICRCCLDGGGGKPVDRVWRSRSKPPVHPVAGRDNPIVFLEFFRGGCGRTLPEYESVTIIDNIDMSAGRSLYFQRHILEKHG